MRTPISRFPNRFALAFAVFLALILIGTSGYHWVEGMNVIDALYMTVITISTVGFGEVRTLSPMGRVFTMALILGGGGLAAFSITAGVDFIMSGEWRVYWEKRRRARMLSELNNHVIVCGFGRIGKHVSEELKAEGVPFIVVDIDPEQVTDAQTRGYLAAVGNAANENMLHQVGIDKAKALVAAVNSDAENVFITLTARSLKPDIQIVARANYEDSEPKLLRAGANRTIMPYHISGKRVVTTLVRPSVADFLDEVVHAGGMELFLEEVHIQPDSFLAGKTVSEAQVRSQLGITILACRAQDGEFDTRVGPDTVLQPGGVLIVLGTREQLRAMMQLTAKP
ncbi:MAG: potassium channel protein [Anaerolineales bacterium]